MKLKILPWEKDEWLSKQGTILPFDKLEHFLIALIGVLVGVLTAAWCADWCTDC